MVTKTRRHEGRQIRGTADNGNTLHSLERDADQAVDQDGCVEVEQQAGLDTCVFQVRHQLRFVDARQFLDGFYFEDDLISHDNVRPIAGAERSTFVHDRESNLSPVGYPGVVKLEGEAFLVMRFEHTRAEMTMDLNRQADDCPGKVVVAFVPSCLRG